MHGLPDRAVLAFCETSPQVTTLPLASAESARELSSHTTRGVPKRAGVQPHRLGVPPPPHVAGGTHVPQLAVRVVPQLSVPTAESQFLPAQMSASEGEQHVFGSGPVTSQTWGAVHAPQPGHPCVSQLTVRVAPQLSVALSVPQVAFSLVQNAGSDSATQPQTLLVPQVCGEAHIPQFAVCVMPQLSGAVMGLQFLARKEQRFCGVQQTLGVAAGACEHSCPPVQPLHVTAAPQLSVTVPHLPAHVVAAGLRKQPQTLAVTAPHAWPAPVPHTAVPQVTLPVPQPLGIVPQLVPDAQAATGVQPHTPALPPPPQVCGAVHVPQLTGVPPHPSGALPQFCPAAHAFVAVSGVQPHTFATLGVPPPQVCGAVHVPHTIDPLHPSDTEPQFIPVHAADRGVHPHTFATPGVPPPHV
jgi:hypothetical protein